MPETTTAASLEELLRIPYVLDVQAVEVAPGEWACRVGYDELPGCVAEGRTPFDALTRLERLRVAMITELYEQGNPVPAPRAPLRV